jgi:hypothetical protein
MESVFSLILCGFSTGSSRERRYPCRFAQSSEWSVSGFWLKQLSPEGLQAMINTGQNAVPPYFVTYIAACRT